MIVCFFPASYNNEQPAVVVPDVILEGGQTGSDASAKVAEVVESLSPRSMRSTFAGMWSRTLRVKITGKDGTAKLDVSIPVSCCYDHFYVAFFHSPQLVMILYVL